MTSYLNRKGIRIFDYARFADDLRDKIRKQIDSIVSETGVEVHYLKKSGIRNPAKNYTNLKDKVLSSQKITPSNKTKS